MDTATMQAFFMWSTIINVALLAVSFVICAAARDWIYSVHSRWFPISREAFHVAIYSFLGLYKILILMFNVVPYVALLIVG